MAGNILPPMPSPRCWLMKSEPKSFSFDDLVKSKRSTNHWDGVRNFQARNYMREMRVGDKVLFYHSNCDQPGVVGLAEVVRQAYPDHTQFDPKGIHYDPKARRDKPIWDMVDLRAIKPLRNPATLDILRETKGLEKMILLRRGNRLSVTPVTAKEWEIIVKLGG